jgi:hypothetical protein
MTPGMAGKIMTDSVVDELAPVAPVAPVRKGETSMLHLGVPPVAPVAPVRKGETSMLNLGHVLPKLSLMTLERDGVLYMKETWFIVFFYECLLKHVDHIVRDLHETQELSQEIVTLTVVSRKGEWFTLARGGAKTLLGMVPYWMTRKELAELLEEFMKLFCSWSRGWAQTFCFRTVQLKDGQTSVIKMRQEKGKDEDGDGWVDVRVVWLGGKEYVSTRDAVKHTIEKTGWQVLRASTRVEAGIDAWVIETHKYEGSGEKKRTSTKGACF